MAGATHVVRIDRTKSLAQEPHTGHNRWHPDIPPILRIDPGDSVELWTRDGLDDQITPVSSVEDVPGVDFTRASPLTGPIYVNGAEPGDQLEVQIGEITPQPFAWTAIFLGAFLRDVLPDPFLAKWSIDRGFATSAELPGVHIPGAPFMGMMGVAPSTELLRSTLAREEDLLKRGGRVSPPEPIGAVPGVVAIARHGLRAAPPRETGGNLDIKHLSQGATVLFPVYVEGALFSVGDGHFAQGDGEVCGTAIEMGAIFRATFRLRKGSASKRKIRDVQYIRQDTEARGPFFATTGLSVGKDGVNQSEDLKLAARNALLNMIDHLVAERGYSRQQAFALCSVAVDLRVSELVNAPNYVVSACLSLDIFV